MKNYIIILVTVLFFVISFSCGKDSVFFDVDCDECESEKPDSAYLLVRLSFSDLNDSIPLVFYRGKIEDNVVEWVDTATYALYSDGDYELFSPVNKYYSIKAEYKTSDGRKITAVDGNKFATRHVTDVCDEDCWLMRGKVLDVRLKYD